MAKRLAAASLQIAARAEIQRGVAAAAPKPSSASPGFASARIQAQRRLRRIMALQLAGRTGSRRPACASGPTTASISSRAMAPGRSSTGLSPSKPITVDSRPSGAGPPSRMKSTLPPGLRRHAAARGGADPPGRIGAGRGDRAARPAREQGVPRPDAPARAAPPCPVPRSPAPTSGDPARRGSTRVKAPGQNVSASRRAADRKIRHGARLRPGPPHARSGD